MDIILIAGGLVLAGAALGLCAYRLRTAWAATSRSLKRLT